MGAWCTFKIERTSYADGRLVAEADLPKELIGLQAVGAWDGLQIFPDAEPAPDGHWQFPRISVGWVAEGRGYVVQCFETANSKSFFLSMSARLSEPEVYIELGGSTEELWPKQLFVPYDLAAKAIQHFLATGLQDPELAWVGLSRFQRKTVPRRLRPGSDKV